MTLHPQSLPPSCLILVFILYLNESNHTLTMERSSCPEVFCKKGVLRNFAKFTGKHQCQSLFLNKVAGRNFIKKETLAQVFTCEFFEIFKNAFLCRPSPVAASVWKVCILQRLVNIDIIFFWIKWGNLGQEFELRAVSLQLVTLGNLEVLATQLIYLFKVNNRNTRKMSQIC